MRSKIRGTADAVLSSFGTILNFDAIIDRLDFTYSDKRQIHVIEQEMGTLRQQRRQQDRNFSQTDPQLSINKNPYYTKQVKAQVHSDLRNNKLQSRPEPMEVDPSAKVCIPAQAPPYQNRRPATFERTGASRKQQRANHVTQSSDQEGKSYANAASSAIAEIKDDGENPCCPSSDEE